MNLLKHQKNKLYDIVSNTSLNKKNFTFYSWKISYWDDFFFRYDEITDPFGVYNEPKYYFSFSPWMHKFKEEIKNKQFWDMYFFWEIWVWNLEREITELDKWEAYTLNSWSIDFGLNDEEIAFSKIEKENITRNIWNIKQKLVSTKKYKKDELDLINQKLDYAISKIEDLNKFDWKNIFMWIITNIMLQCSFWPEWASTLWNVIKTEFSKKFIW